MRTANHWQPAKHKQTKDTTHSLGSMSARSTPFLSNTPPLTRSNNTRRAASLEYPDKEPHFVTSCCPDNPDETTMAYIHVSPYKVMMWRARERDEGIDVILGFCQT
jgi:hypothetical protein